MEGNQVTQAAGDGDGHHPWALAVGIAVTVIWGAAFSIQKAVYDVMQPGPFLFLRSMLLGACALVTLRWMGLPWRPALAPGEGRLLLIAALIGPFVHVLLVSYAIHWTTPFASAVILACGPVFTLLLLRLTEGTRLSAGQAVGVALALAGVLMFLADKLAQAQLRASGGDLLMLVSTLLFSLYTIRVTPLVRRHGGLAAMCWATLVAAPLLMVVTAWPTWQAPVASFPATTWAGFLWSTLVSSFLCLVLWSWVNAVRGVTRTAPLLYLVPPVAGLVGWLLHAEALTGWKLAGAALAMIGVALVQTRGVPPA